MGAAEGRQALEKVKLFSLLGAPETMIRIPYGEGLCAFSPDDASIVFGLVNEKSKAGSILMDALWHGRTITGTLIRGPKAVFLTARPYQCHVTGPVFSEALRRVRNADPEGDIACAWEIQVESAEELENLEGPPPERFYRERITPDEAHLDHPMFRS